MKRVPFFGFKGLARNPSPKKKGLRMCSGSLQAKGKASCRLLGFLGLWRLFGKPSGGVRGWLLTLRGTSGTSATAAKPGSRVSGPKRSTHALQAETAQKLNYTLCNHMR